MECKICKRKFYIRRGLLDLFHTDKEIVCNSCYKKYPIHLQYEAIELDRFYCVLLPIFDKKYSIDYNCFQKEYSKIVTTNMKKSEFETLFFNHVVLDDNTLEALDAYSKMLEKNLIVVCFSLIK